MRTSSARFREKSGSAMLFARQARPCRRLFAGYAGEWEFFVFLCFYLDGGASRVYTLNWCYGAGVASWEFSKVQCCPVVVSRAIG